MNRTDPLGQFVCPIECPNVSVRVTGKFWVYSPEARSASS